MPVKKAKRAMRCESLRSHNDFSGRGMGEGRTVVGSWREWPLGRAAVRGVGVVRPLAGPFSVGVCDISEGFF
jgi:hypothetical protein